MLARKGRLSARYAGILDSVGIISLFFALILARYEGAVPRSTFIEGFFMGLALACGTGSLIYKIFGPTTVGREGGIS